MNRYSYTTGVAIACAAVTLAIYTGMLYEEIDRSRRGGEGW